MLYPFYMAPYPPIQPFDSCDLEDSPNMTLRGQGWSHTGVEHNTKTCEALLAVLTGESHWTGRTLKCLDLAKFSP